MKIGHVTRFVPAGCGLYEASRDMAKADILAGHDVYIFDGGSPSQSGQNEIQVGAVDDRCGFKVVTAHPDSVQNMDLLIMHSGIDDKFVAKGDCPIVWVLHGKPLDCWNPEARGERYSLSLYKDVTSWQRCKAVMYFWKEYKPYWEAIIKKKHYVSEVPCIDVERYTRHGKAYNIQNKGELNIMIADSVRDDVGLFESMIACIEAAKYAKGLKFHFVGSIDNPEQACYRYLLDELKSLDALGDVLQRVTNIEEVYRSMDLLISPNRIVNRVVMEATLCGLPVIQEYGGSVDLGSKVYFSDPHCLINLLKNKTYNKNVEQNRRLFDVQKYINFTNTIYSEIGRG